MTEIFKDIPTHQGLYQVSNTGKVLSKVDRTKRGHFEMAQTTGKNGYKRIELRNPKRVALVHRLVVEAFIDQPKGCNVVNHIDSNRSNNCVTNLEWGTQSTNMQHAENKGRLKEAQIKGGRSAGVKQRNEAQKLAEDSVGKTINCWTIDSTAGIKDYGYTKRNLVNCTCVCGTTAKLYINDVLSGTTTQCNSCTLRKQAEARIREVKQKAVGKTFGTWNVTRILDENVRELKQVKFVVTCTECGYETTIPKPALLGTKPIKRCKNCQR